MRTSATTTGSKAMHRNPSSHRPARRQGPRLARTTLSTLLLLAVLAIAPSAALAGDITYTWHEDDSQSFSSKVTGLLTVTSVVLKHDVISLNGDNSIPPDVVSFQFYVPVLKNSFQTFDQYDLLPATLQISKTDATPDSTSALLGAQIITGPLNTIALQVDFGPPSAYTSKSPEHWTTINTPQGQTPTFISGDGYWSTTVPAVSTVPEPPSAVLAAYGALAGLAYGWFHRRNQRRQRPVGPPEATE